MEKEEDVLVMVVVIRRCYKLLCVSELKKCIVGMTKQRVLC